MKRISLSRLSAERLSRQQEESIAGGFKCDCMCSYICPCSCITEDLNASTNSLESSNAIRTANEIFSMNGLEPPVL